MKNERLTTAKTISVLCVSLLILTCSGNSENRSGSSVATGQNIAENYSNRSSNQSDENIQPRWEQKESDLAGIDKFIGCWTGEKGGGLRISYDSITWYDQNRGFTYSYELVSRSKEQIEDRDRLLITVKETRAREFLRQYILFKAHNIAVGQTTIQKTVDVFGFDVYDDVQSNRFASAGRFYPARCKDLGVNDPRRESKQN